MLTDREKQQIQDSIQSLTASYAAVIAHLSFLSNTSELEFPTSVDMCEKPVADESTFCVIWKDNTCFLGNTLLFWMFRRLARSANRYVTHNDLMEEVWEAERQPSTIRGVAKRLRERLIAADMESLACAIDGSVSGHYGLMLI